ncbi:cold-shock protein [Sphingobacterium spiritivorum]|uniref:cold-shock protein n=1 Tax=Sphingobacterium TaxID=28453 RepID=UPI0019186A9D|nr:MULTISPECIES: cold shock domain-containing protein [Sphingobacterium]QQT26145.1 cold shock domain-containing protein [Sphingobacterium spiritivorum]
MAQTQQKKENQKKKLEKRKSKEQKKEYKKTHNSKGKSLEEMFVYVDEFGNLSNTPPTQKYEFKPSDLERPVVEEEFSFGKVSFFNEQGQYGFIRNNETRESVYFNTNLVGFVLYMDQKVKFKYQSTKQGLQVTSVEVIK